MTKAKSTRKKVNSRWTAPGKNPERYTRQDAALLRKIHEENGWKNGARVKGR